MVHFSILRVKIDISYDFPVRGSTESRQKVVEEQWNILLSILKRIKVPGLNGPCLFPSNLDNLSYLSEVMLL